MSRRIFLAAVAASASAAVGGSAERTSAASEFSLVLAPSNLGLRMLKPGHEPGAWRAPRALIDAGLAQALGVDGGDVLALDRPAYESKAQPGTRIRNGNSIRRFSLDLSEHVCARIAAGKFPVVIGGDCSVLLGAMRGLRLAGGRGLVHVDGHSDFTHPGNYDTSARLGSAAGMDLALASGRGEPLLTSWPGVDGPLADDADILQIGEREIGSYNGDVARAKIAQRTAQQVVAKGIDTCARDALSHLERRGLDCVWLHVDLDVLDEGVMPAVDSPGSPGLTFAQLSSLIATLRASGRVAGADFSIYDPEEDPQHRYAQPIVQCIAGGLRGSSQS